MDVPKVLWLKLKRYDEQHVGLDYETIVYDACFTIQSNLVISRAVNAQKSVSRGRTLDPKFSDSSLAAAHMTEPMTHMC